MNAISRSNVRAVANIIDLPADVRVAWQTLDRLHERLREVSSAIDTDRPRAELVGAIVSAADTRGSSWPSAAAILDAEQAEAERVHQERATRGALGEAQYRVDATIRRHAGEIVDRLEAALQSLMADEALRGAATAVPLGESADSLLRRGGAVADAHVAIVAASERIAVMSACRTALLDYGEQPTTGAVFGCPYEGTADGLGDALFPRTSRYAGTWGAADSGVGRLHYALVSGTELHYYRAAQLDSGYRAWVSQSTRARRAAGVESF